MITFLIGMAVGVIVETLYLVYDVLRDPAEFGKTAGKVVNSAKEIRQMWGLKEVSHPTLDQCRCKYCGCNNYIEKPQWLNVCNDCYEGHQNERARNSR